MEGIKRRSYIDVVAGLMILWMVIDHCRFYSGMSIPLIKSIPLENLLGFYMPWFYYKSGLFFSEKNQKELIQKDASKLLRYYIVYSFIGWQVWCICGYLDQSLHSTDFLFIPIYSFIKKGAITGNGPLWFLISLFCTRQVSNIILKKKLPPPVVAIFSFLIAYMLYVIGWYKYSWWFGNIFSGIFFFLIGYSLKNKENNRVIIVISVLVYAIILGAYVLGHITDIPLLYFLANKMIAGDYLLFFPYALACITITNNVFRLIEKRWGLNFFLYAEYIGKHSMNVYTTHMILLTIVLCLISNLFAIVQLHIQIIILVSASLICLPILSMSIEKLKAKYELLNKIL